MVLSGARICTGFFSLARVINRRPNGGIRGRTVETKNICIFGPDLFQFYEGYFYYKYRHCISVNLEIDLLLVWFFLSYIFHTLCFGCLTIPCSTHQVCYWCDFFIEFTTDQATECVLRNLIAFEQCHYSNQPFICNYDSYTWRCWVVGWHINH